MKVNIILLLFRTSLKNLFVLFSTFKEPEKFFYKFNIFRQSSQKNNFVQNINSKFSLSQPSVGGGLN